MQITPLKYGNTEPERENIRWVLDEIRKTHKDAFMVNWTHDFTGIVVKNGLTGTSACIIHLAEIMDDKHAAVERAVEMIGGWA